MKLDRTGFILYVRKYKACIAFYRDQLQLPILFDNDMLTCFAFGASYLMVEVDDKKLDADDGNRIRTCLRMNVADVKQWAEYLQTKGIEHQYGEYEWGTIAKFYDPDGNLLAFKDTQKFEQQIQAYQTTQN